MKKRTRLLIIIASSVVLLATALCLLLGANKWVKGGEDTPYPYAYQLRRDGVVRIRIREDTTGGYSWRSAAAQSDNSPLSAPKVGKNTTEFTVTPRQMGLMSFTLHHSKEAPLPDGDYAFDFLIGVAEDLSVHSVSGNGRDMMPVRELVSTSGYQFRCAANQPVEMMMQFSSPEQLQCNWKIEAYDKAVVEIEDIITEDGGYDLTLSILAVGQTNLRVVARPQLALEQRVSDQPGIVYSCQVTVSEEGRITISDETFEEFTGVMLPSRRIDEFSEACEWLGRDLALPEGSVVTDFYYSKTMAGTPIAVQEFLVGDAMWNMVVTTEENASTLLNDFLTSFDEDIHQASVPLQSGTLQLLQTENLSAGFWQDAGGVAWYLENSQATAQVMEEMALAIWQANAESSSGNGPLNIE